MFLSNRLSRTSGLFAVLVSIAVMIASPTFAADRTQTSAPFAGPKANTGFVTFSRAGNNRILSVSSDFVTPDTPDPHWQVIDSEGNVYLLERLPIKEDRENRSITLPRYVRDVAKVVIWCAFAEVNLGEAAFAKPAK